MYSNFILSLSFQALAEESGRKTRNSGNVRLPRAGLRNGKIFSKSDSDDEGMYIYIYTHYMYMYHI